MFCYYFLFFLASQDIYNKFKSPDIATIIKVNRLKWLVQTVRMDEAGTVRKLVEGKPGGRRKKGRPRLKRMDNVEVDLNMDVIRWRTRVLDRTEWASVETQAKVKLEGLL